MATEPSAGAGPSILLVDDDAFIAELLTARLRAQGYRVTTAADGRQALEAVAREVFDLIVCDVVMPEMDGPTLCRRLRADGQTVPFIFLTAKGQSRDIAELLNTGADDYVVKPFEAPELLARIKARLRRGGGKVS